MGSIIRNIFGVITGIVVCGVVIMFAEGVTGLFFPLPKEIDPSDWDAIRKNVAGMPAAAFACIVASWVLGAFSGGLVAGLITGGGRLWPGLIVSAFPLLGTMLMVRWLPHPLWAVGAAFMLEPLAALAGAKLAGMLRKSPSPAGPEHHDMRRENMAC